MQHSYNLKYSTAFDGQQIRAGVVSFLEAYSHILPNDPGARIVIKPNLNANMNALTGNTTDLRLLSGLISSLKDFGYRSIVVAEGTNSGFYRNNISVISRLKIDALARYYGIEVQDLNYAEPALLEFEDGEQVQVARACLESDCMINVPKLKTHFETGMSVCLKNLIGCLVGQENKKKAHQSLAANILRLHAGIKPDLQLVDALIAMEGLGPTRGTPVLMNLMLCGDDPFVVDLVCARLIGMQSRKVTTLRLAEQQGLVTREMHDYVQSLEIDHLIRQFAPAKAGTVASFVHNPKRQAFFLKIRQTRVFSYLAKTRWFGRLLFLTGLRQDIFNKADLRLEAMHLLTDKCKDCGFCAKYCPLGLDPCKAILEQQEDCIQCLYCYMVCPYQAIALEGNLGFISDQLKQYDTYVRQFYASYCSQDKGACA